MNDLASSGIEILIQVFFDVPDGHAELMARDELILDILRLADRLGISFDNPTIVLEREHTRRPGKSRAIPFRSLPRKVLAIDGFPRVNAHSCA